MGTSRNLGGLMRGSYGDFGSLQYAGIISRLFGTEFSTSWKDQLSDAQTRIEEAVAGQPMENWKSAGTVSTSQMQSPSNTNGAYARNAFWLATVARIGIGHKISPTVINKLIAEAKSNWMWGSLPTDKTSTSAITERLGTVIPFFQAAEKAGIPFATMSPIYQVYKNMMGTESIAFRQAVVKQQSFTDLVVKPTAATAKDIGAGAADLAQMPFDFARWAMKWGPWIVAGVGGVVVISAVAKVASGRRE